jgi:hypothetical protein
MKVTMLVHTIIEMDMEEPILAPYLKCLNEDKKLNNIHICEEEKLCIATEKEIKKYNLNEYYVDNIEISEGRYKGTRIFGK